MKKFQISRLALAFIGFLAISISATSCKKDSIGPVNHDSGTHYVDSRLIGSWLWTKGSSGAYYDDNGVYQGAAYGFATKYIVNSDGYGSYFSHISSTLGQGSYLEVNISSQGFYETDDQGHLGYFPLQGTYKSTSGTNRALRPDELWNTSTKSGRNFLSGHLEFTTQGGRECFTVTADNGVVDTFFKVQ